MLTLSPEDGLFLIRTKKMDSGQYALSYVVMENGAATILHHAVTRSPLGDFLVDSRPIATAPRTLDQCGALVSDYRRKMADAYFWFTGSSRRCRHATITSRGSCCAA